MIHGDVTKRLEIIDYDLGADGIFIAPTIWLTHPQTPFERQDIIHYLRNMMDRLVDVYSTFLSVFCDRNVRTSLPMFETRVARLPGGELISGSPFVWETRLRDGFELETQSQNAV